MTCIIWAVNYADAIGYILSFTDYERDRAIEYSPLRYSLDRPRELLRRLGDPHLAARTVHIAGTKGKGSTAAMISSALSAAGYRVGLFTSPHLHSFCERIQVDGQPIAEAEWAALTEMIRPHADAMQRDPAVGGTLGDLTTFELLTTLAFLHFSRQRADFQVLETGLGGRLDATNVAPQPLVCVITNISFDHMAILGDTLAAIATEKAGIIKAGAAVVSAPQADEAAAVIADACQRLGAPLTRVGSDVTWRGGQRDLEGQELEIEGRLGRYQLRLPLLGAHQQENAATAMAALEALAEQGVALPSGSVERGLAATVWPARFEVLRRAPLVVVDGAHNDRSAACLRDTAGELPFRRCLLIVGASADKDIAAIAAALAPLVRDGLVIATRSQNPRAMPSQRIAAAFADCGVAIEIVEPPAAALARALQLATPDDLVLATGSLFVAAEIRQAILAEAAV